MNDELHLTDQQLRPATTRSLPDAVSLEAEVAMARDDFLALGSALDSAAAQFDEAALVARLQKSCLASDAVLTLPGERKPASRNRWALVLAGSLAAAALLAIARIASESWQRDAVVATPVTPGSPARAPRAVPDKRLAAAWNDPLDDEIALAAATIDRFGGHSRNVDDSLLEMNERLDALSQELKGDSL